MPSGPKPIQWPLWLNCGHAIDRMRRAELGSATFLSVDDTVYSSTTLLWSYHSIWPRSLWKSRCAL